MQHASSVNLKYLPNHSSVSLDLKSIYYCIYITNYKPSTCKDLYIEHQLDILVYLLAAHFNYSK